MMLSADLALAKLRHRLQCADEMAAPKARPRIQPLRRSANVLLMAATLGAAATVMMPTAGTLPAIPTAHADGDNNTLIPNNKRLNDGVVANVFTMQHQAGCTNDVRINPQLQLAAQWHARDVLNNPNLDGDPGSDGSTPQDRANAAGFHGQVAETVAINPAVAISGVELINQWYYNPADFAIMSDCTHSQIGVWSENSPGRTVVVAVYGQPEQPVSTGRHGTQTPPPATAYRSDNVPTDSTTPDYDMSDELEYGDNWLAWILRGVRPPPGLPPQ